MPAQLDDYSSSVAEMRTQTDPGESGSESQASTLAGEIERIRYAIAEAKGTTYWYQTATTSIATLNTTVAGLAANSRNTIIASRMFNP